MVARRIPHTKPYPWETPKPVAVAPTSGVGALRAALHAAGVRLTTADDALAFEGSWGRPIPDSLMAACEPHLDALAVYAERVVATAGLGPCPTCGGRDWWERRPGSNKRPEPSTCERCNPPWWDALDARDWQRAATRRPRGEGGG